MSIESELLILLNQKKEIFLTFEQISENMAFLTAEDLPESVEQREYLLEKIAAIDAEMQPLLAGNEKLQAVLNHNVAPDKLSAPLAKLYEASLGVKAIINRILKNSNFIREHMENEQERILMQMEDLNKSGAVVAERYHQSVSTGVASSFNRNKGKII